MHKLILLRHGQSEWNTKNLFTGWTDVDLDEQGREQARTAGRLLKEAGILPDIAFTSLLKRAIRTLWISLDEMDRMWIPDFKSWRLNERHYGALQGLNKAETAEQYGEEQVKVWRRTYDVAPPTVEHHDERHPRHDPRYGAVHHSVLPQSESLADTLGRFFPYWIDHIVPEIQSGKTVFIAAHGNTLRALVKQLDSLSEEEVIELNIPTGEPLVYELDEELRPMRHYYLSSPESIAAGVQSQVDMGKAKN